ncbi:hypothetical protein OPQ81_007464 [Rhizoctonia solani]|nr:hypothetical protein OPQ81_007464 [Rhizoctonia solani]
MQTTRLHISGLTPSISASDLKQRFSTFGEVSDVDGVGKLDGVGRPRKFAYLTLETTQPKLARCMNLLSGSTWKGAKLRIGEAKPDYKARHERELNPPPPAPRPKLSPEARRRARLKFRLRARRLLRGTQGRELKDMSLVTLDNVSKRKGWRRTPLNHLIRPMRMRPLHPLPPLRTKKRTSKTKLKKKLNKRKFELARARYTVIDPARYGAVHLKDGDGLLGAEVVAVGRDEEEDREPEKLVRKDFVLVEQEPEEVSSRSPTPAPMIPQPISAAAPISSISIPASVVPQITSTAQSPEDPLSLTQEKLSALALLGGMFGNGEWGGRESVSGDEMEVVDAEGTGEAGYEIVPQAAMEGVEGVSVEDEEEQAGKEEEEDIGDKMEAQDQQEDAEDDDDDDDDDDETMT